MLVGLLMGRGSHEKPTNMPPAPIRSFLGPVRWGGSVFAGLKQCAEPNAGNDKDQARDDAFGVGAAPAGGGRYNF